MKSTPEKVEEKKTYVPLELVKYPDQRLFEVSQPVEVNEDTRLIILRMLDRMGKGFGWGNILGMAAPQLGFNIRVFYAQGKWYLNPELTWVTKAPKTLYMEGCFSLKDNKFDYPVWRATSIRLKWQDLNGDYHEERFNGEKAQVILHELDHLDGKVCHGDGSK